MKNQKTTFADVSSRYIDKPFVPGGRGPDGYDCIGFCYAFLQAMGKKVIDGYGDVDIDNYHHLYRRDVEEAERVMFLAFDQIGAEVRVGAKLAGDLVIVKNELGRFYPGIYAGNGHVMASFVGAGVRVVATGKQVEIVKARRV